MQVYLKVYKDSKINAQNQIIYGYNLFQLLLGNVIKKYLPSLSSVVTDASKIGIFGR